MYLAVFFQLGMKGDGKLNIKVTLKVTTRYFFLFTFEEITDVFIVFNGMVRSIGCTP